MALCRFQTTYATAIAAAGHTSRANWRGKLRQVDSGPMFLPNHVIHHSRTECTYPASGRRGRMNSQAGDSHLVGRFARCYLAGGLFAGLRSSQPFRRIVPDVRRDLVEPGSPLAYLGPLDPVELKMPWHSSGSSRGAGVEDGQPNAFRWHSRSRTS